MTTPVRFRISAPEPGRHLYHVEATIHGLADQAHVDILLPVWTPGSYFVREYAKFLQSFGAKGDDQRKRHSKKIDKARWRVDCRDTNSLYLSYDVYAHDLGVRNNHLDASHGFITPTATFVYPEGRLADAVEVEVAAPEGWDVFCPLRRHAGESEFFEAEDFDALYDAPIEMGANLESFEFTAGGKPHTMVFWGRGNWNQERLERDVPAIIEANAEIFGGELPYDDYLFVTLLTDTLYGGLEHRNSTALMYPRHEFEKGDGTLEPPITDDHYLGYLTLVAHEHFHTWHVKRIRPETLGPFDYQNENYTRDIWTIEGITSYYHEFVTLRAGLVSGTKFLETIAKRIKALETVPGRAEQSIEESSFDAWIGLYRPHENNINNTVSYYLKGQIVALLLDVYIRTETRGESSLDDVMRALWQSYSGDRGYPEGSLETIVEETTGVDMIEFFDTHVRGTDDPNYDDIFEGIGLELKRSSKSEFPKPWIGVKTADEAGRCVIKAVRADGPAAKSLSPGDEIVAINGWRVTPENFQDRLRVAGIGERARVHVFRRGELMPAAVLIAQMPDDKYTISLRENAPDEALNILEAWLGTRDLGENNAAKN